MPRNTWLLVLMACALATTISASAPAKQPLGQTMDQTLHLYQFTNSSHQILLARVTQLSVRPEPGGETVEVVAEITETLWREAGPVRRVFVFQRPASPTAQLKFPDPVWGRVKLQEGVCILVVATMPAAAKPSIPVYVDQFADPSDPALMAVRSVLETERTVKDRSTLFRKRLTQLRGTTVEKLFAGEALAGHGPLSAEEQVQLGEAFPRAYAEEKDDYVRASLGSWLWDLYPRLSGAGQTNTLNATMQVAGSASKIVRTLALDYLAQASPKSLLDPAVKPTSEVVRLLDARREAEVDAGERHRLEEIIAALRR